MNDLAIIIPAYKAKYFHRTLESLARQTCKRFNVYIGNDCSPEDLESTVSCFSDKLNISYTRFSENLGGKDLVAQWNRCIALSTTEKWLWLFSDDDVLEPTCVEDFYRTVAETPSYDVFHFNVDVIDENDMVIRSLSRFPRITDSAQLYRDKMSNRLDSFVVEYIFSREIYEQTGGFVHFDLAWGTDLATWVKFGKEKGIRTIVGANVRWRESEINITPDKSVAMTMRKMLIDLKFLKWAESFLGKEVHSFNQYALFRLITSYSNILSRTQVRDILGKAFEMQLISSTFMRVILIMYPIIAISHKLKHIDL